MPANEWTAIVDRLHEEARQNEREARETVKRVQAHLLSEQAKFASDFTEWEKRVFGVKP